jgi:hypothetical protein
MRRWEISGVTQYRTIDEARVVDLLLFHGGVLDVRAGDRAAATAKARAALDRCVGLGLGHRSLPTGERLFDPVEVMNFLSWAGVHRGDRYWEDCCVATGRQLVWRAHSDETAVDRPPSFSALAPRRYAVSINRSFNLAAHEPGERVRLRLPLPIEDVALDDLTITPTLPGGMEGEARIAPARLDVLIAVPADRRVTIGVKVAFIAQLKPSPGPDAILDPAEAALYTRQSEGLIKVSDRVRSLAADLAGAETDPWVVVRRFWTFMLDELACGSIHYDALDPACPLDRLLDQGWYDCQTGSALFAALCRARGLPARLVSGYLLYAPAPAFHTWLEVWIDGTGWTPFDLGSWNLSAGGRGTAWRDCFFGRVDHRMAVERPPRLFNGAGAVRLPHTWHMLSALEPRGAVTEFRALDTGALVYQDHVEVENL